jgi:hypothetical protein
MQRVTVRQHACLFHSCCPHRRFVTHAIGPTLPSHAQVRFARRRQPGSIREAQPGRQRQYQHQQQMMGSGHAAAASTPVAHWQAAGHHMYHMAPPHWQHAGYAQAMPWAQMPMHQQPMAAASAAMQQAVMMPMGGRRASGQAGMRRGCGFVPPAAQGQ